MSGRNSRRVATSLALGLPRGPSTVRSILDRLQSAEPRRAMIAPHIVGEDQRCPNCGHSAWLIGRSTAECGACGLPLALVEEPRLTPKHATEGPARITPVGALIDWVVKI